MELVCKYAPHVLVDEQKRVKQFKEGLRLNIRVQVAVDSHFSHAFLLNGKTCFLVKN